MQIIFFQLNIGDFIPEWGKSSKGCGKKYFKCRFTLRYTLSQGISSLET